MNFKFNIYYFIIACLIFITELLIAFYATDSFIRPIFGDFLVVILLYFALRSITNLSPKTTLISVVIFAFIIEITQYFQLIKVLNLQDKLWAKLLLGTTFHWDDLIAYLLGGITAYLLDFYWVKKR
jgi:hypothetical protein